MVDFSCTQCQEHALIIVYHRDEHALIIVYHRDECVVDFSCAQRQKHALIAVNDSVVEEGN